MPSPERQPKFQTPEPAAEPTPEDRAHQFLSQAEELAAQPASAQRDRQIAGLYKQINNLFKSPEVRSGQVSPEEAERIMAADFFGSEAIKQTFGIEVKETPPIQFSSAELERAKALGQELILFIHEAADGEPLGIAKMNELILGKTSDSQKLLYGGDGKGGIKADTWYKDERFLQEAPRAGWRLVSKEIVPDSQSKNYLEQTEHLIEYAQKEIFIGAPMPEKYNQALTEFQIKKEEINELLNTDWKKAGEILEDLEISRLIRETTPEALYRLILNERVNKERSLTAKHTWTQTRSSGGDFVVVGHFGAGGVNVNSNGPDSSGALWARASPAVEKLVSET